MIYKLITLLFAISFLSVAQAQVVLKNTSGVKKKSSRLVSKGSSSNVKVKLISTKKKKKKKYKKRKKIKKIAKKQKKKKKKKSKKKIATLKTNSKKAIINSMKTCAIYKPPGKKSTLVLEATSEKRKVSRKKRCKAYRRTKKNGRSVLVIEVDEHQI